MRPFPLISALDKNEIGSKRQYFPLALFVMGQLPLTPYFPNGTHYFLRTSMMGPFCRKYFLRITNEKRIRFLLRIKRIKIIMGCSN